MQHTASLFYRVEHRDQGAFVSFLQPYLGPAEVEEFDIQMRRYLESASHGAQADAEGKGGTGLKIILDLSAIEHTPSLFLGVIVDLHQQTQERGGRLRICGVRPNVMELFALTHLDLVLGIDPTPADAVRNLA